MRHSVALVHDDIYYKVGDLLPTECIVSDTVHGPSVLLDAEQNPEGEDVLIVGRGYFINKREYDLSSGYALKAVIRDGQIIPKLRAAKGEERYILTRMIKRGPRQQPERVGEMNDYWPETKKVWVDYIQSNELVDEALNVIEEVGSISEDFALPQDTFEPIEYYEEE